MKRTHVLMLSCFAVATLVLASGSFAGAGAPMPSWTSSPTAGPSPNTIIVSGTGCEDTSSTGVPATPFASAGIGAAVLGGEIESGTVTVRLRNLADTEDLHTQTYPAADGEWGGPFQIPAGLAAGTYPLKATCDPTTLQEVAGLVTVGQTAEFDYQDRSYTVVVEAAPPEPVDAEVTFTG